MKLSKYIADIKLDDSRRMLYSTLSRQYYIYGLEEKEEVQSFLQNLNKGEYDENEIALFKTLLNKKIIVRDDADELKEMRYMENSAKYQDSVYKIIIYTTNACNFRCTYCEQRHEAKQLSDEVSEKILKLVSEKAKVNKRIEISWFGGEPFLEYDRICSMLDTAKTICYNLNCELVSSAATNGYLISIEKVEKLKKLGFEWLQITLDGNRKTHDKRRILANGEGTFDIILKNIESVLKQGIRVTLRINVDEENISDISEVIEAIPEEYRGLVQISICNVFQNEKELSTYGLLKQAIEKGYTYAGRSNRYTGCHAGLKNATVIDTSGNVLLCSNTDSEEKRMGVISDNGKIRIERMADYYNLKTVSALDNPECRECIELPFCISSCKYARLHDNSKCLGKSGDGLSLEERALLDYYYDMQKQNIHKGD